MRWTQTPEAEPLKVYGSDAASVRDLPGANTLLHPRLPYLEAEVRWAVRYELARTVEDVLARRTRSLLLNAIASMEAATRVAAILAEELSLDTAWQQQQIEDYNSLATGYLVSHQGGRNESSANKTLNPMITSSATSKVASAPKEHV